MMKHTKHFCMVIDRYTKQQINNLEQEIVIHHDEYDTASWYDARQRYLSFLFKDKELIKMLDEKHTGWCIDSCEVDDRTEYQKQLDKACGRG